MSAESPADIFVEVPPASLLPHGCRIIKNSFSIITVCLYHLGSKCPSKKTDVYRQSDRQPTATVYTGLTYLADESSLVAGNSCSVEVDILRLIIVRCVLQSAVTDCTYS